MDNKAEFELLGEGTADRVQSVERAFRLLETLARRQEMSLGQLAQSTHMNKSTAYRLLHTLKSLGYVAQDVEQGSYRVGLRMVEMGGLAVEAWPLHRAAEPIMEELARTLGEAVNLAVPDDGEMVYVATLDARNLLRMQLNVGRRSPMHCTAVGKAILAYDPKGLETLKVKHAELARCTENTIVDWTSLEDELDRIRHNGYAVDDEEQEIGARCVAAPIQDATGRALAAVGISAPSARLLREQVGVVGPIIMEAARRIARR